MGGYGAGRGIGERVMTKLSTQTDKINTRRGKNRKLPHLCAQPLSHGWEGQQTFPESPGRASQRSNHILHYIPMPWTAPSGWFSRCRQNARCSSTRVEHTHKPSMPAPEPGRGSGFLRGTWGNRNTFLRATLCARPPNPGLVGKHGIGKPFGMLQASSAGTERPVVIGLPGAIMNISENTCVRPSGRPQLWRRGGDGGVVCDTPEFGGG